MNSTWESSFRPAKKFQLLTLKYVGPPTPRWAAHCYKNFVCASQCHFSVKEQNQLSEGKSISSQTEV